MKITIILVLISFSLSLFAKSESKTFFYNGTQDFADFILTSEETHTEYRYEQRESICQRRDVYYRNVCRTTQQGQRICDRVPHYRTITYRCLQTVRIPYEVKDFDVEANVRIQVVSQRVQTPGESFKFTLTGDELSLSASGSKKYFLILKDQQIRTSIQGTFKYIDASYVVELVEASPITRALRISDLSYRDDLFNFITGPIAETEKIGIHLMIKKAPLLGSDKVLFDRELSYDELELIPQRNSSEISVNLANLGVEINSGRYILNASAFFKFQGRILNESQFEAIEVSKSLVLKK